MKTDFLIMEAGATSADCFCDPEFVSICFLTEAIRLFVRSEAGKDREMILGLIMN